MRSVVWNYMQDGAGYQARAVLMMLQGIIKEDGYTAFEEPTVARWENCREQGYVISTHCFKAKNQLYIAFFEHRNSDSICAVKWNEPYMLNSPTIDTADFGGTVYKDKFDVSFSVGYGEVAKMAEWINDQIEEYNEENLSKKE